MKTHLKSKIFNMFLVCLFMLSSIFLVQILSNEANTNQNTTALKPNLNDFASSSLQSLNKTANLTPNHKLSSTTSYTYGYIQYLSLAGASSASYTVSLTKGVDTVILNPIIDANLDIQIVVKDPSGTTISTVNRNGLGQGESDLIVPSQTGTYTVEIDRVSGTDDHFDLFIGKIDFINRGDVYTYTLSPNDGAVVFVLQNNPLPAYVSLTATNPSYASMYSVSGSGIYSSSYYANSLIDTSGLGNYLMVTNIDTAQTNTITFGAVQLLTKNTAFNYIPSGFSGQDLPNGVACAWDSATNYKDVITYSSVDRTYSGPLYLTTGTTSPRSLSLSSTNTVQSVTSNITTTDTSNGIYVSLLSASTGSATLSITWSEIYTKPVFVSSPSNVTYPQGTTGNSLSWNATDDNPSTYTITRNSTQVATGSWTSGHLISINTDGLAIGSYKFTITVNDLSGNSLTDTVFVFVKDSTGPTVDLVSLSNDSAEKQGTNISLSITDISGVAQVEYHWDNNGNTTFTTTSYITQVPAVEEVHNLTIYASDSLGNWDKTVFEFITDNTPPTIGLLSPGNDTLHNSTVIIQLNITDANSVSLVTSNWDGTQNITLNNPYDLNMISTDGLHKLIIYAKDGAGNIGEKAFYFKVQNTLATIKSLNYQNDSILKSGTVIKFNITDPTLIPTILYKWDTQSTYSTTDNYTFISLVGDGNHVLTLIVKDLAGNEKIADYTFITDDSSPVISSITPTPGLPLQNNTEINLLITDLYSGVSKVEYNWDMGTNITGTSHLKVKEPSKQGLHTLSVYYSDNLGNTNSSKYTYYTDDIQPYVICQNCNAIGKLTSLVTLKLESYDNYALKSLDVVVDGTSMAEYNASSKVTSELFLFRLDPNNYTTGSHVLELNITDLANNYNATLQYNFVIPNNSNFINSILFNTTTLISFAITVIGGIPTAIALTIKIRKSLKYKKADAMFKNSGGTEEDILRICKIFDFQVVVYRKHLIENNYIK